MYIKLEGKLLRFSIIKSKYLSRNKILSNNKRGQFNLIENGAFQNKKNRKNFLSNLICIFSSWFLFSNRKQYFY